MLGTLLTGLQVKLHFTNLHWKQVYNQSLDFIGLLGTSKAGSQATSRFTVLLGVLQTGLLTRGGPLNLRETTGTCLRAAQEFADL